jgi:hypothetical protein
MRAIQSVKIKLTLDNPKNAVLTRGLFLRNAAPSVNQITLPMGSAQGFRGNLDDYLPVNTSGINGPNGMKKAGKGSRGRCD